MEASVAAAGGEAEAAGQQQEGSQEQQAAGVDLGPVLERVDQVAGRLGQIEQSLQSFQGGGEGEEEGAGAEEFDATELYAENGEIDEQAAARYLEQVANRGTERALQEALQPIVQQIEDMRIDADAKSLLEAYPEMADPQVAEKVVQQARQMAIDMGLDPSMAARRGFIELVFKASKADQQAAGEVPVGDLQQHELEGGAGAAPGSASGPSIAERIKSARGGNSFWGT